MNILTYESFVFNELYENKSVTPGGEAYPKFGWCVIMAGGPGSGKGWNIKNKLMLQGKHFDVDKFKEIYVKMQARINPESNLDLKNPETTKELHGLIKNKGWKEKERETFIKGAESTRLPNIIFDITSKDTNDISDIIDFISKNDKHYKVALVWVAINRSCAIYNNFNPSRGRVVPEGIFHDIHNKVNATMLNLMTTYRSYGIDEFWCIKNSNSTLSGTKYDEDDSPTGLEHSNVIDISNASAGDIAEIKDLIGLYEPSPNKPINYMSFEEIQKIDRKDQRNFTNFYKR